MSDTYLDGMVAGLAGISAHFGLAPAPTLDDVQVGAYIEADVLDGRLAGTVVDRWVTEDGEPMVRVVRSFRWATQAKHRVYQVNDQVVPVHAVDMFSIQPAIRRLNERHQVARALLVTAALGGHPDVKPQPFTDDERLLLGRAHQLAAGDA